MISHYHAADPPKGADHWEATKDGYNCARDLVAHISKKYPDEFCVTVAGPHLILRLFHGNSCCCRRISAGPPGPHQAGDEGADAV